MDRHEHRDDSIKSSLCEKWTKGRVRVRENYTSVPMSYQYTWNCFGNIHNHNNSPFHVPISVHVKQSHQLVHTWKVKINSLLTTHRARVTRVTFQQLERKIVNNIWTFKRKYKDVMLYNSSRGHTLLICRFLSKCKC